MIAAGIGPRRSVVLNGGNVDAQGSVWSRDCSRGCRADVCRRRCSRTSPGSVISCRRSRSVCWANHWPCLNGSLKLPRSSSPPCRLGCQCGEGSGAGRRYHRRVSPASLRSPAMTSSGLEHGRSPHRRVSGREPRSPAGGDLRPAIQRDEGQPGIGEKIFPKPRCRFAIGSLIRPRFGSGWASHGIISGLQDHVPASSDRSESVIGI